jgi:poly(3-hydroxybutyrate) depolymerase
LGQRAVRVSHSGSVRRTFRAGATLLTLSAVWAVAAPYGATAAAPSLAGAKAVSVLRGWPCTGCLVVVPAGYDPARAPALVVALHGDEGAPDSIASLLSPVTGRRNTILFAPQCPTARGCRLANGAGSTNSWWGWLQYSRSYDDGWLGGQIARVEARFAVDRGREYVLGWSGGADYLGWYALRDGGRFAAAAFVAGGGAAGASRACSRRGSGFRGRASSPGDRLRAG